MKLSPRKTAPLQSAVLLVPFLLLLFSLSTSPQIPEQLFLVVPVATAFQQPHSFHYMVSGRLRQGPSSSRSTTTFRNGIQQQRRRVNYSPLSAARNQATAKEEETTEERQGLSRRQVIELAVATTGVGISVTGTREVDPTDYGLWGIFPLGTYRRKKTIRETIVDDQLWTLDQKFGILNVQVPLRMTVLRLSSTGDGGSGGGLLIYNPIAATQECLDLVQELVDRYGCPVKHIVVGSVALEHKVYGGVFAQKFPSAQVWLTPGQYSVPANLPEAPFLGYPLGRTHIMPDSLDAPEVPAEWRGNIDWAILGPIISRDGAFAETVIFHPSTKTLLVTDTCLVVTDEVPAIYDSDPAPLLYHARDTVTDVVVDTPESRRKGWKRVVLFGLFFTPSAIRIQDFDTAIRQRRPDINADFAGVYPWDWVEGEEASWIGLTGTQPNRPLVAPILQTLLLNRSPVEVLDFADRVKSKFSFTRVIPAHLKNNLVGITGTEYRAAFDFLTERGVPAGYPRPLTADLKTLLDAEVTLIESGAIAPRPPKLGGSEYSRAQIIQQTLYRCRGNVCAPKASPE